MGDVTPYRSPVPYRHMADTGGGFGEHWQTTRYGRIVLYGGRARQGAECQRPVLALREGQVLYRVHVDECQRLCLTDVHFLD